MEIKWYALAEKLGLMADISHQYNDGAAHYTVSARAGDVFSTLLLLLIPALFLTGFLLRLCLFRRRDALARRIVSVIGGTLLIYALLLAVGVGPYIQFYPQGVGFIDLALLEHILSGLYCTLLAALLFLGGWLGRLLARRFGGR